MLLEVRYRKVKALLLFFTSFLAVTLFCSTFLIFQKYDSYLVERYSNKRLLLEKDMSEMWDKYRRMTKKLGFNVLILPKKQNLSDFYSDNFASEYMPQWYADTLAQSKSVVVQHILPTLMQKTIWPERNRTVLTYGVQKENTRIHFPKANKRMPILEAVHPDSIVLGYELWKGYTISPGDSLKFMNRNFVVSTCHEKRGNRDDITIWINLAVAQKLFNKPDQINAILALECRCSADMSLPNIAKIRKDLATILPNTQVIEFISEVLARAEARHAAIQTRKKVLLQEKAHSEKVKTQQLIVSTTVTGVCLAGVFLCIIILTIIDTRNRKYEIGQLLSIGFRKKFIVTLFIVPVVLLTFIGTCLGCIAAIIISNTIQSLLFKNISVPSFSLSLFVIVSAITPLLLSITTFITTLRAVRIEPSSLLREDM